MTSRLSEAAPEFGLIIRREDTPFEGRKAHLEANADARALIAHRLGAPSVDRLSGDFVIRRTGDGLVLTGAINAALTRQCVVSREPMQEIVAEDFEIKFSQSGEPPDDALALTLDIDTAEPLPVDGVDLGELLIQQLSLLMDPNPRREDAGPLIEKFGRCAADSPFSALRGAFAAEGDKE